SSSIFCVSFITDPPPPCSTLFPYTSLFRSIAQHDVTPFFVYAFVIAVMIICDILSKGNPARMLLIFSGMGIVALVIGMLTEGMRSEEHTSELQSLRHLVCRLLLEKKKQLFG